MLDFRLVRIAGLPLAGAQSRVVLTYRDRRIASVAPGQAFDSAQWDNIAQEIERRIHETIPNIHSTVGSMYAGSGAGSVHDVTADPSFLGFEAH